MTLRIRELIIRAEIGTEQVREGPKTERSTIPDLAHVSESGSMTREFFEEDIRKNNER